LRLFLRRLSGLCLRLFPRFFLGLRGLLRSFGLGGPELGGLGSGALACKRLLAAALLLGCARVSGEVGITMMLGGNISERTNTLSLEIFNAVSRADFDAANALCLLLSLFAAVIFLAAELLIRRSPRL